MAIKLRSKRGSTLVLVLLVLAFVVIMGTGIIMVAGASAGQTNQTLGQQQADYTAQSVLDALIVKIRDGSIVPHSNAAVEGGGTDDALGSYQFSITPYDDGENENLYKVTVDARYAGTSAQIYSIIQGFAEEAPPQASAVFSSLGLATAYNQTGNSVSNATIRGDLVLDNGGATLTLAGSGSVTGDIDVVGGLSVNGSFKGGTQGDDNIVRATGNIAVSGSGILFADVYSDQNVDMSGSGVVHGSVESGGDVTVSGSGNVIDGDVLALGNVTVSGSGRINGDIYAGGNLTALNNVTLYGDVYVNGNATITGTVRGNLYVNGSLILTGNVLGDVRVVGDGTVSQCSTLGSFLCGGNLEIKNSTFTRDVYAAGNIRLNSSGTINGSVRSGGNVTLNTFTVNGGIFAVGSVTMERNARLTGNMLCNGTVTIEKNATLNGDIQASGDFILEEDVTGDAYIGGNGDIRNVLLTGDLTVIGDLYLTNKKNQKCVTGVITLGGQLLPGSNNYGNTIVYVDPDTLDEVPAVTAPQAPQPVNVPVESPRVAEKIDTDAPAWNIPAPTLADLAETVINVNLNKNNSPDYTISGNDHIIDVTCTLTITGNKYGKNIVFDATDEDLYILLKHPTGGNTVTIPNGVCLLTRGNYNVYIFLDDGAGNYVNLSVGSNTFAGYYDYRYGVPHPDPRVPNLFFILNHPGTPTKPSFISFSGYNTLYGFIYAPYSRVTLNSSSMTGDKLSGAVVASKIEAGNMLGYTYYKPNLPEEMTGGGTGGSGGTGTGTSWALIGTYFGNRG